MAEASARFLRYCAQQNKKIVIVLAIDGMPGVFSSAPLNTRIRYGDPDVHYGDPGLVYGGLRPLASTGGGDVRNLIQLDGSSLTLSQRLEPEQGRGSVSTLSFQLIDKDEFITQLFSPGVVIPEIMNVGVTVYLGFEEISYPEDFYQIFRGRITQAQGGSGFGFMQISDPNVQRRQDIFYSAKTSLSAGITAIATTIPVVSNGDFHQSITNPLGAYDPGVKFFMKIDDEFIEYGPTFNLPGATFGTNTFGGVVRGARGTTPVIHSVNADVSCWVEIQDNCIDMALKLMLSGWNGPWKSGIPIMNVVKTNDPILMNQAGAYILPSGVDAVATYNLQAGDWLSFTGDPHPANNGTFRVVSFGDLAGTTNRIIYTDNSAAVISESSPAVFSIRSQYDTYPTDCGSKLGPLDVDIERHIFLQTTFLGGDNILRFIVGEAQSCKTFLESEVYLPTACYSLTRFGRLSVGLTKPPIADERLQFLTKDNVINAPLIRPVRGVNMRRFFNEIVWQYDADEEGNFASQFRELDTDSLNRIGLSSVLPINSKGGHSDLGVEPLIERRSAFLLSRYKFCAVEINPQVNYGLGVQLEAGDVVALQDNGDLQIQNWNTGQRDLGTQLWEIIERTLDLKAGNVQLKLLGNVGAQVTDRFGTIAPSSQTAAGSTTTHIVIKDSYGALFPGNEKKKWEDYVGSNIVVHSDDWQQEDEREFVGVDPTNPYVLIVSPPLSFTPGVDYVVEIPAYPTDTDPYTDAKYKAIHVFLSPSVAVVAGISSTVFSVAPGDLSKFRVGATVLVHSPLWTNYSEEVTVTNVDTGTNRITVNTPLGFTPAAGDTVEFIGFADGGGAYRFI